MSIETDPVAEPSVHDAAGALSIADGRNSGPIIRRRELPGPAGGTSAVHVGALRLVGIDGSRRIADAHDPFLGLLDALHHVPTTVHLTLWLRWLGRSEERFEAHLLVASPESRSAEVEAIARAAASLFDTPASPWALAHVDMADLQLPTDGHVQFIRQKSLDLEVEGERCRVPIRFAPPGPGSWNRLIAAFQAIPDRTDLLVTLTPTRLTPDEEGELARIGTVENAEPSGAHQRRLQATAVDTVDSLQTAISMLQLVVVGASPLEEMQMATIGSALSSPFHVVNGDGYQIAAPRRRYLGGFVVDPSRHPEEVLRSLAAGCPWIGTGARELRDLVTGDETSFLMSWPVGSNGDLPGVMQGEPPELTDPSAGSVVLGHLRADGRPVHLTERDRTQHLALFGGNGTGKTAAMFHLAQQDLAADRSVWILDEPADLLRLVAAEVEPRDRHRVVLLDLVDPSPHTVNLLRLSSDPIRRRRLLTAVHDGLVADLPVEFHGPVGRDNLQAVLLAFSELDVPLDDLLYVFEDADFAGRLADRASLVGDPAVDRVPAALRAFHRGSVDERVSFLRWLRAKITVLTDAASVLGASSPTHDIDDLLAPGALVLIRPPHDVDSARLVSSVVLHVLAEATANRTLDAPGVSLFIDEVQRCAGAALRQVMNESRKRGVAVHVATQHLRNVDSEVEAILGNAGTILTGRLRGRSAGTLATELQLDPGAVQRLRNGELMGSVLQAGGPVGPLHLTVPARPPAASGWPGWLGSAGGDDSLRDPEADSTSRSEALFATLQQPSRRD